MDKLGKRPPSGTPLDSNEEIRVGQWYWWKHPYDYQGSAEEYLACVVHVGSNYVEIDPVTSSNVRVHLNDFDKKCRLEPDPEPIIKAKVDHAQARAVRLMGEVHELTARLALGSEPGLTSGASEGQALAKLDANVSADEHKAALIKAKEKTLPELFKGIESAHKTAATWMTAAVIPLKANAEVMKGAINIIEGRIFNVELYAGLTEQVKLIREGEPAGVAEKVHLMQRMHYMDEECLANYEVGGMTFNDLPAFDAWIAKNMARVLPFPKCMVAFRVRRSQKEFESTGSLWDFINFILEGENDKKTYLYIRNGDRVYRMCTALEFGHQLFPDMKDPNQGELLWVEVFGTHIKDTVITQGEYEEMAREDEALEKERQEKYRKASKKDRWQHQFAVEQRVDKYEPFNQSSVFYDDILKQETRKLEKHNRIVLILQGLLDRSEVFHPHPTWHIWTPEGFHQALELVYDDTRALVAGGMPDFEAYRKRLNASIGVGTVTIGQDHIWARQEGDKYREKLEKDWRRQGTYAPAVHRPYGNPGPGLLARVAEVTKTKCVFKWHRERRVIDPWTRQNPKIPCSIQVARSALFNVDAYTPGDFKQFYDDPRSRALYLKWAPLLIRAEEYKAGNLKVDSDEVV